MLKVFKVSIKSFAGIAILPSSLASVLLILVVIVVSKSDAETINSLDFY